MEFPPLDVPAVDTAEGSGPRIRREGIEGFPEVSEIEVIRHFTRLSTWNYAIDLGMYPLGSCTMKYNPRVNEFVARLDGLATEHPEQPQKFRKAACEFFEICKSACSRLPAWTRQRCSPPRARKANSTGLADDSRAISKTQGNPRKKVLIPDSAHGTNPAYRSDCWI